MKLKKAGILTKLVIAALLLYGGATLVTQYAKIAEAQETQSQLQEQENQMIQGNAELEYEIKHANDPDTIESIAREKLGLVMPGERIFYDVSN